MYMYTLYTYTVYHIVGHVVWQSGILSTFRPRLEARHGQNELWRTRYWAENETETSIHKAVTLQSSILLSCPSPKMSPSWKKRSAQRTQESSIYKNCFGPASPNPLHCLALRCRRSSQSSRPGIRPFTWQFPNKWKNWKICKKPRWPRWGMFFSIL